MLVQLRKKKYGQIDFQHELAIGLINNYMGRQLNHDSTFVHWATCAYKLCESSKCSHEWGGGGVVGWLGGGWGEVKEYTVFGCQAFLCK